MFVIDDPCLSSCTLLLPVAFSLLLLLSLFIQGKGSSVGESRAT